jgi:GMP synthase-like glutamine amidotransferase
MAILVLTHSNLSGTERLGEALRDHGHQLDVVALHEGEPVPPDLDDVDAILSCGGPQRVHRDPPEWLDAEMALIRAAHERAMPVVGICLGCQIVAKALGGEVTALDGPMELGWHPVDLTPAGREDPLYAGQPWTSMQIQWHGDHVSRAPDGARVLAMSSRGVQSWALGLRTYGIQYHPETVPDTLMAWAADEPDEVDKAGLTMDDLRAGSEANYAAYERLSRRFFQAIAQCLMPVDRRYAGVAKDLHH